MQKSFILERKGGGKGKVGKLGWLYEKLVRKRPLTKKKQKRKNQSVLVGGEWSIGKKKN